MDHLRETKVIQNVKDTRKHLKLVTDDLMQFLLNYYANLKPREMSNDHKAPPTLDIIPWRELVGTIYVLDPYAPDWEEMRDGMLRILRKCRFIIHNMPSREIRCTVERKLRASAAGNRV